MANVYHSKQHFTLRMYFFLLTYNLYYYRLVGACRRYKRRNNNVFRKVSEVYKR